jgi:hypothetical protein
MRLPGGISGLIDRAILLTAVAVVAAIFLLRLIGTRPLEDGTLRLRTPAPRD